MSKINNKNNKNLKSSDEYNPEEILQKGTWVLRLLKSDLKLLGITHHGLVMQDGGKEIVNYDGEGFEEKNASICKTTLDKFVQADQDDIFYVLNVKEEHKKSFEEIDKLINSRLGEKKYHITNNNCEIFVRDALIKPEFNHLYQHQAEYIFDNIKAVAKKTDELKTTVVEKYNN